MRVFFGVPVDDEIRSRVREAQDSMRSMAGKVSWVDPANFHLTLRFIGEVPQTEVEAIGRVVEGVGTGLLPVRLVFRGVGAFPNVRRPRVLWIGLAEGTEALSQLSRELNERLCAEVGLPPEDQPFVPHLTIGRVRVPSAGDVIAKIIEPLQDQEYGAFWATHFALYQSTLTPRGAIYRILRSYGDPFGVANAHHA